MKTNTSLREFLKKTWLWLALLGGLVCFRTLPFFLYPGIHFDSDQATFGMMAIHLAKLQALPVFMYGQKYLLALQSYFAAPFFMFMNEQTVVPILLIKIPELLTNLLTVWLLFFILVRKLLLKPSFAFLIALPLALPAIALSAQWMNASGGHIEPILLVLILYLVRYRPVLFAVVAAIAVLHREWLLAPVLALWVMLYFERRTGSAPLSNLPKKMLRKDLKLWLPIFFGVIIGVEGYAYTFSPNFLGSRTPFKFNHGFSRYLESFQWIAKHVSLVLGLNSEAIGTLPIPFFAGSVFEATGFFLLFLLAGYPVFRLFSARRPSAGNGVGPISAQNLAPFYFASYLLISFLISAAFYALKLQGHDSMLLRYLLLAAFLPSAFLIYSYVFLKNARLLQLVSAIAMILGAFHFSDHLRYLQMLRAENRLDVNGALAQFLSDHRVRYAIAPYWRAYDITFRTQGKIIVASSQLVRIPAYQELYQLHANGAPEKDSQSVARIDDRNCQDGTLEWVAQIPVCLVSARPTPGHQVGN